MLTKSVSRKKAGILLSCALLIAMSGCAAVEKPQFGELLWPPPPLTSRIKFVRVIHSKDDLGKSAGELFADALLGKKKIPDSLARPMAIAVARGGKRLYISDYDTSRVFGLDLEARTMRPLGDEAHRVGRPFGIALDSAENVYVVDSASKQVRVFDAEGRFLRDIVDDSIERPTGIAIDNQRRRIYVADSSTKNSPNHVIHVFSLDGTHLKTLGGQGTGDGKFFFPTYLALDGKGNLYVADTLNSRVQVIDPEGRHLKTVGTRGDKFGMFDKPKGVAVDTFGNLYVVDSTWSNVQIFNPRGEVLLFFAGNGRIPGLLNNPTGIAIDENNRIYVADAFNSRIAIYQLINTKAEDSFDIAEPKTEKGGSKAMVGEKGGEQARVNKIEADSEKRNN